jgi:hypothetical protein
MEQGRGGESSSKMLAEHIGLLDGLRMTCDVGGQGVWSKKGSNVENIGELNKRRVDE